MKNDPLCIKEDVCDMAVCDGALHCGHAVLKSSVLVQQPNNNASPKLPGDTWNLIFQSLRNRCINPGGHERVVAEICYSVIARQNRA